MSIAERDRASIWHPLTQHFNEPLPKAIVRGEGAYLFDQEGRRYIDLISSWWVNIHGHARPEIAEAIYRQAKTLEQVVFAGFTHEPAVMLAENILKLLPQSFGKVFFSDNGATAVEVALKMAYQFWQNKGEKQRKRFIAFKNGYHGDTFGSMSVGNASHYFINFKELLFPVDFFAYPGTWQDDPIIIQKEQAVLTEIQMYLAQYPNEVAALIIEPLVQGAGGMNMCRPQFLQQLETCLRSYNVLMIYDEVMTGFGRTGDLFACIKTNTQPDIICLSKGLTGGFLPLSLTVCKNTIYDAFLDENFNKTFVHSHSFTANPLGCAAALASLEILLQPETTSNIQLIEKVHRESLGQLSAFSLFEKMRSCGTIAAFNVVTATQYGSSLNAAWRKRFMEKGLLIRPLGPVIYLLPPYCISESDLRESYEIIATELQGVCDANEKR